MRVPWPLSRPIATAPTQWLGMTETHKAYVTRVICREQARVLIAMIRQEALEHSLFVAKDSAKQANVWMITEFKQYDKATENKKTLDEWKTLLKKRGWDDLHLLQAESAQKLAAKMEEVVAKCSGTLVDKDTIVEDMTGERVKMATA
jgi:hypothetical protein